MTLSELIVALALMTIFWVVFNYRIYRHHPNIPAPDYLAGSLRKKSTLRLPRELRKSSHIPR